MNYLKYWRIVRYFINAKYGISQPDLEMLIFLSDEHYFTKAKFKEFNKVFSWDKDRFERLRRNGWIEKVSVQSKSRLGVFNKVFSWDKDRFERLRRNGWIEKVSVQSKSRLGVYNLTYQAKRIVAYAYALLHGKEFPEGPDKNPVFKRNCSFNDKMYRSVMMEINSIQRQHRAQKYEADSCLRR